MEFRHHFRQDLWNADVDPPPTVVYLDEKRKTWDVAAFLQWEWSILDNLILNAGVRFDYYESFGDTWNPRVALIYNLENTTFKALYGSAFRGPNAYERFYEGTGFSPNPDLDPERIQTAELVVEHAFTPHLRGTAAGYYYWINDLVDQDTSGSMIIWTNRGKTEAFGLELQLEAADLTRFHIDSRIGYALQEAKDRLTDERLTNSPSHKLNFNLSVPLVGEELFGSFELLYLSSRNTLAGDKADDYTVSNLTLFNTNSIDGLEISASVRNLFDERYFDPGSGELVQDQVEQDGRTFWFKVKYGF
jgi:iron complex outermembrane receptor protein